MSSWSDHDSSPPLLERVDELARLEAALGRAAAGSGGIVVVEGPPGIGKTSLLSAAMARAVPAGLEVLHARAGHLEHDLPWGVVRHLFTGPVLRLPPGRRREVLGAAAALAAGPLGMATGRTAGGPAGTAAGPDPADPEEVSSALHGLYWLCSNLAERRPLLVVVDDVHWADAPSQRWLAYLAARIDDLPVLLALAVRTGEPASPPVAAIGAAASVTLRPGPLSPSAGAALLRTVVHGEVADDLCRACHSATGGNPFLLAELAGEIRQRTGAGERVASEEVAGITPEAVVRTVLLRLARLPDEARRLALAVAVLGTAATVADAGRLAGLAADEAAATADTLFGADVLESATTPAFVHPLVREVIYGESPPMERAALHRAAARLLAEDGAEPEAVAAELLRVPPGNDRWVVEQLGKAAEGAVARRAPEAAADYLARAVAERPAVPRAGLLHQLGLAEAAAERPEALEHLWEAHAAGGTPATRCDVALDLAPLLQLAGRFEEAGALCRAALDEVGEDRERALRLVAVQASSALLDSQPHPAALRALSQLAPPGATLDTDLLTRLGDQMAGGSPAESLVLVVLTAVGLGMTAGGGLTAALARRALGHGTLLREVSAASPLFWYAPTALMFADRYDECAAEIEAALSDARRRGSALGFAMGCCFRSVLQYRAGTVAEAVADARLALGNEAFRASPVVTAFATMFLVDGLIERGELDEAEAALRESGLADLPPVNFPFSLLHYAAGRLALAGGDPWRAVDLLEGAAPAVLAGGTSTSTFWRATLASALAGAGRTEEAVTMAAEAVAWGRRTESAWAEGLGLRTLGTVSGDVARLEQAVRLLEPSPCRLERAWALCDLGTALRRSGSHQRAVATLRSALEGAEGCGASALAERARRELAVAGERVRPRSATGVDLLTPGERRVAEMARGGMANREIAQALFVSLRTVETHLTHAYQKLGISSRRQLRAALVAGSGAGAPGTVSAPATRWTG